MAYNDIYEVKYRAPTDDGLIYLGQLGLEALHKMYTVNEISSVYPMAGSFMPTLNEVSINHIMLRMRPITGDRGYNFFFNKGAKDRAVRMHTQSVVMLIDGVRKMTDDYLRSYVMARDKRFTILDHNVSNQDTKIIKPSEKKFPVHYAKEMISLGKYHTGAQFFEQGRIN